MGSTSSKLQLGEMGEIELASNLLILNPTEQGTCLPQKSMPAVLLLLRWFPQSNRGFASGCTFTPTERQKWISGNYSLIISRLSALRITRDKNKTHDHLGMSKVVLDACEGIG